MTLMPAGVPKNSADSNASMPRMKLSTKADDNTGIISISVVLKNTFQRDAPDMEAASSSDGSMARNASTVSRNRNVMLYCDMCQITPP